MVETMTDEQETARHESGRLAHLIQKVTGLDENQAKMVAYYAIATHGLPKLKKFPILTLRGGHGTGKTTLLGILKQLAYQPRWIEGDDTSRAALRDELGFETTALLDEADSISERPLRNRYARESAHRVVNRERRVGWKREELNLFGATVLHRRRPYQDAATTSRSVEVHTQKSRVTPLEEDEVMAYAPTVSAIAHQIDWSKVKDRLGDRILDTWAPLMAVAEHLRDADWLAHARERIKLAQSETEAGQGQEPNEAVYSALLALAIRSNGGAEPEPRVLLADVRKKLQDEGHQLSPWQIGSILRGLGFVVKKEGGEQRVHTGGRAKLVEVGKALAVKDDWLDAREA